jgi:hypothetical protein
MRSWVAAISLLALSGCTSSDANRADYLPEKTVAEALRIDGRVLVDTTPVDDEHLVTAVATSFAGSGAKLTTPVGTIAREVAVRVFSRAARDGAVASSELGDLGRYSMVVRPEVMDFSYGFPQLKNLGFAITPEIQLGLRLSILDETGKVALEKEFDSGRVQGSSCMISGSPYERISRLLRESMQDLTIGALAGVRAFQRARAAAPGLPPAS